MPDRYGRWKREQEQGRLATLRGLGVLDTPREERFDAITRLLARDFDVPISMISLVDDTRVWFKSAVGLAISEAPRELAFCSHAIQTSRILVIEDARRDERFAENPLVTGEAGLLFYAGAVIHSPQRQPLGAVCILDHQPRKMNYHDRRQLIDFAAHVGREMARSAGEAQGEAEAVPEGTGRP